MYNGRDTKEKKRNSFEDTKEKIEPIHEKAYQLAKKHWDLIAKPLHSLGKLEDIVCQLAGIYGTEQVEQGKKCLVVFCADNGVVEAGVSQTGQDVTAIVAENFRKKQTCTAIMAERVGMDVWPMDVGMVTDTPNVEKRKIAYGTKNMLHEPAMTYEEALLAIETGIEIALECQDKGYKMVAAGEMGIGNTTTSSAIVSVLLSKTPAMVTGRGAGLSNDGLNRKIEVIEQAIEKHQPKREDPLDVLAKLGGFDIACMVGFYLGAASVHLPILLDGFISKAAALVAIQINPTVRQYMIPSHTSYESADGMLAKALGLEPILQGDFCLGEGSGAVFISPLIDMAVSVYQSMGTFENHKIEAYKPYN